MNFLMVRVGEVTDGDSSSTRCFFNFFCLLLSRMAILFCCESKGKECNSRQMEKKTKKKGKRNKANNEININIEKRNLL